MATEYKINLADLPQIVRSAQTADRRDEISRTLNFKKAKQKAVEAFESRFIVDILISNKGNVSKAAREIGLDRRNLQRKCKYYKIKPKSYLKG